MNRTQYTALTLGLSGLLFSLAAPAQRHRATGPATPLRLQYVAGQHQHYALSNAQTATVPTPATDGGTHDNTSNISSALDVETVSVDPDGTAHQRMTITAFSISSPGASPEQIANLSHAVVGMTIEYTQNSRGQIANAHPGAGVDARLAPIVQVILQSLDETMPVLPDAAVAVGGSWNDHNSSSVALGPGSQISLGQQMTYTLRALQGSLATLHKTVAMSIAPGASVNGGSVRGLGTTVTDMTVDLAHGVITHSAGHGNITIHVQAGGQNVDVPLTFTFEQQAQ